MRKYLVLMMVGASLVLSGCVGVPEYEETYDMASEVAVEVVEEEVIDYGVEEMDPEYDSVWITIREGYSENYILDEYNFVYNGMVAVKCHTQRGSGSELKITRYDFLVDKSNVTFMKSYTE